MNPVNPVITIDRERCTTPFDCKRCLRVCPPAVFQVHTAKMVRGVENDPKEPGAYLLAVAYRDKCSGCMKCVEACPSDALTVAMPEEVSA